MELRIKREQDIALDILEKLKVIDPECFVAGGAPRDWTMGKTCRDIDVFYRSVAVFSQDIVEALETLFPMAEFEIASKSYIGNYSDVKGIKLVVNTVIHGKAIQFICSSKDKTSIVEDFDASINRVVFDEYGLLSHDDFLLTQKTGMLFFNKVLETTKHGKNRKKEMVSRFVENGPCYHGTRSRAVALLLLESDKDFFE